MSADPKMLAEFEDEFRKISDGDMPRPGLFGYSRLARQVHNVELAVTQLRRQMSKNPGAIPLPAEPLTAYERWVEQHEEDELGAVFADIYRANPKLFGVNTN